MARRHGVHLISRFLETAKAQVVADGNRLAVTSGSQLTSLYQDVLQPQQLTCLRQFTSGNVAAVANAAIDAEGKNAAAGLGKQADKPTRRGRRSAKADAPSSDQPKQPAGSRRRASSPRKESASPRNSTMTDAAPEPTPSAAKEADAQSGASEAVVGNHRPPRKRATSPRRAKALKASSESTQDANLARSEPSEAATEAATGLKADNSALAEVRAQLKPSRKRSKPAQSAQDKGIESAAKQSVTQLVSEASCTPADRATRDSGHAKGVDLSIGANPISATTADSSSRSSSNSSHGSTSGVNELAPSGIPASASAPSSETASEPSSSSSNTPSDGSSSRGKKQRSQREATVSRRAGAEGRAEGQGSGAEGQIRLPSYQSMKDNMPLRSLALSRESVRAIRSHLTAFKGSAAVQDQSLALYVNSQLFFKASEELGDFIFRAVTPEIADTLTNNPVGVASQDALFNLFAEYVVSNYSTELQTYRRRVQTVDMRQSHLWYPVARALKRKIIYHAGPTNSGKTYQALKAMKEAETGLYCGPLRLLAMEVFDSVNQEGVHCNLITGQERQMLAGARHVSCTIEMVSTTKQWDCAVIDEIQMIGDDQRGWAWTRALQGVPANEIHLCGDASALPLVSLMCADMNEPLTVMNYDRFTQLEVQDNALTPDYSSVQPGDCVVAFSRRDIFDIKTDIERRTGHKCCVIYGALPPEMRRNQAELFNEPNNGYDILVASDAVGMGLNLNIRRIIFHKVQKTEGKEPIPVTPSQIKQIAGRAGRRSSIYPKGFVGTRSPGDLPRVIEAVNMPLNQLRTPAAGLFPEFQHLELLAGQVPQDSFATLLNRFSTEAKLGGTFFFCRQDGIMQIAKLLERLENLSLEDRFDFAMAPANIRDARQAAALLHFASRYSQGLPSPLDIALPTRVPLTAEELRHVEATHQVMSLWIWLSHRFGSERFPGLEDVASQSETLIDLMDKGLEQMCQLNKGDKWRPNKLLNAARKLVRHNAPLLEQQDPLAMAYLDDVSRQKFIHNYEWAGPDDTNDKGSSGSMPESAQRSAKRLQAA